ncbi:MAG: hypothetical protein GKR90_19565 [Pseudomonadales bacterium]|nr:hypothetical protein [Pseudomonadales bacterium]
MSDRIYQGEDNQWYYRVRGNQAIGPFESHSEAQSKLSRQLKTWTGRSGPAAVWPRDWHPGRILRRSATRQT